jgi:hypothetical protein
MGHASLLVTLVTLCVFTLCVQMPIGICLGTTAVVSRFFYGGVP